MVFSQAAPGPAAEQKASIATGLSRTLEASVTSTDPHPTPQRAEAPDAGSMGEGSVDLSGSLGEG